MRTWRALWFACLVGCAPPAASPDGSCSIVGRDTSLASLRALADRHGLPLVVAENAVVHCGCSDRALGGLSEARRLAGATEDRRLDGARDDRRLAGDSEARRLAGDSEARRLAGDSEARRLAGDSEARRLAGDSEARRLAGDSEPLVCFSRPGCGGFRLSGDGEIQVFDGSSLRSMTRACVE